MMKIGLVAVGILWGASPQDPPPLHAGGSSSPPNPAAMEPAVQENQRERFHGRWTTSRERKEGEKSRRYQLILEIDGGSLKYFTMQEEGKGNGFTLNVIGVEQGDSVTRFILSAGGTKKCTIYCDFEGDRMILVGHLPMNRPFEGFSLSGEYTRVEPSK